MSGRKLKYPAELPNWKGLFFLPGNKVVRKTNSWSEWAKVNRTVNLLSYLKDNPHPTIVSILNVERISSTEYSYDMPLLAKLSISESNLVYYLSLQPKYQVEHQSKINRLKRKHPKLFQVINKINSWEVYLDLHGGNVMRDKYGNYKLIDIEGFGLSQYSHKDIIDKITARR